MATWNLRHVLEFFKWSVPILFIAGIIITIILRRKSAGSAGEWATIIGGIIGILIAYFTLILSIPVQLKEIKDAQDMVKIHVDSIKYSISSEFKTLVRRTELLTQIWAELEPRAAKSIAKREINKGVEVLTKDKDIAKTIEHFSLSASIQPVSESISIAKIDSINNFLNDKNRELKISISSGKSTEKLFNEIADTLLNSKYKIIFSSADIENISTLKIRN